MVNGLDAVAVGVEEKGAVVVVAVLRTRARCAVVLVTGLGSGAPERVRGGARRRGEADVQAARHGVLLVNERQREVLPLGVVLAAARHADADGGQDGVVELLRGAAIGDADRDVVEHRLWFTLPA